MKTILALPDLDINLEGVPFTPALSDTLVGARVRQAVLVPAQCELVFRDPSRSLIEQVSRTPGRTLRLGVRGRPPVLFSGDVTAVELVCEASQHQSLHVRAYDRLHRLRRRQPVRVLSETSMTALAGQLVGEDGLTVETAEDGPAWPRLMQWRENDLELLIHTVTRAGFLCSVTDEVLKIYTLEGLDASVDLTLGDTLLEARFEVETTPLPAGVRASAWDPQTGQVSVGDASPRRPARAGSMLPTGDGDERTTRTVVNLVSPSLAHAVGEAQWAADQAAAGAAILWGVAEGDPALCPGIRVRVTGAAEGLAGPYVLTEVVHSLDADRGYLAELSSRPPAGPPPARGAVLAPGIVIGVRDPDGLARVQVRLPTYPTLESGWMRVVFPGAGAAKGLICLPDEGDEVLVLLADGDPSLGVVLGGLYGGAPPPDDGVEDGVVRRFTWRTPGGQLVQLDDHEGRVMVSNAAGTTLTLGPTSSSLELKTDLTISAPGRHITIEAAAVDFRKA